MSPAAEQVGLAMMVFVVALFASGEVEPRAVLTFTEKRAWAWEIIAMGYMMKVAQDNREQTSGFYWAKSLTATAIAAFGGGFLAPLVVAHNPVPLMEESYLWMVVLAWYLTHNLGCLSNFLSDVMRSTAGKALFTMLFAIFKTNQIVGAIELAVKAVAAETLLPSSRYFSVPIAAPILCGFLGGCGGAFLPFSKALAPIEEGKNWSIRASFIAPVFYYAATRAFGWNALNAKTAICLFRMSGELFPAPRDVAMGNLTRVAYMGTGLRSTPLPTVVKVAPAEPKTVDGRQLGA